MADKKDDVMVGRLDPAMMKMATEAVKANPSPQDPPKQQTPTMTPQQQVVHNLENMLRRAKNGDFIATVFIGQTPDGVHMNDTNVQGWLQLIMAGTLFKLAMDMANRTPVDHTLGDGTKVKDD